MRCRPDSGGSKELVGETDQCRYGTGEGAPRANEGHEDEWSGVAMNFILRRIQPCKERAHPGFDFKGDTDGTRDRVESLTQEAVLHRAAELFAPNMSFRVPGQPTTFNYTNPPP